MPIESGQNLLHYTLGEKLGEGGMGSVWRAKDNTLGRDVAIKLLPHLVADDAERLQRFELEAKMLASLNHPNIAAVYGLHETDLAEGPVKFLAMELVEGEDLSKRLARGPMSVDQALDVAAQMAAGIEAAHDKGVVHRDLKPANAILAPDGKVKLLDFGLAKAFERDPSGSDPSLSPTMTSAGTVAGMILGTAAYMSPEQARGRVLDRRTDLWSFGCVLYECLTGQCLFGGETVSDSLAAILRKDPDWSTLPDNTPPMVRLLLRRCLARDLNKRLRDAGDARLELEQAIESPGLAALGLVESSEVAVAQPAATTRVLPWAITTVAIAGLLAMWLFGGGGGERANGLKQRLTIPIAGTMFDDDDVGAPPIVSPDGRSIVYGMINDVGTNQLWLRPIDDFEAQPIAGTENAAFPFWSPDSKHIGFFFGGRIKRIEIATGRVQTIVDVGSTMPRGASWGTNNRIVYVPHSNTGVWLVDASGGEARQITTPDPEITDGSHRWPHFLPDGEHFLFLLWTNDTEALEEHGGVYVASVSAKSEPRRLLVETSGMKYAASGHVLVLQENNLIAVAFDASALEVRGTGEIVTDGVLKNANNGFAAFSVSQQGTIVFARDIGATPNTSFRWAGRNGDITPSPVEPAPMFDHLELSPDGSRAAVVMPGSTGDEEVWVVDLERGVRTRLVTPAAWGYHTPIWTENGSRIIYVSTEAGSWDFYVRNADGSGAQEPYLVNSKDKIPYDLHNGKLLYWSASDGGLTSETRFYDPGSGDDTLIQPNMPSGQAQFSPQGRFFTYHQIETGRREVFVQALDSGARWQVSTAGGDAPRWSDDGREIVYSDPEGRIVSVSVTLEENSVTLGQPLELFRIDGSVIAWDATGDHSRFLLAERPQRASEPVHVILNWDAGL